MKYKKEDLLQMKEICEYLKCERWNVYRWVKLGRIKAYNPTGKRLYFKFSDVQDFLTGGEKK